MNVNPIVYRSALDLAAAGAMKWIESIPSRQVAPTKNVDQMVEVFAQPLHEHPIEPSEVVDALVRLAEPGLMAMSSGRFFGWVIGGTLPASLGADWLVSAWDQKA